MDEKEVIAQNLVLYRKKANLCQLDLAKKLNYSNKNISKWENGETTPSVFVLNKIAKLYGITVDDLLCEATVDKQEKVSDNAKINNKKVEIFRLSMLALSNAILFAVGAIIVYVLGLVGISTFNIWMVYLYLSPLCVLSILIYIRVLYKYVSLILTSIIGWLVCIAIYVSLSHITNISLIFILGAAYQLLVIFITILVNLKLSTKVQTIFDKIFKRKINKNKKDI